MDRTEQEQKPHSKTKEPGELCIPGILWFSDFKSNLRNQGINLTFLTLKIVDFVYISLSFFQHISVQCTESCNCSFTEL